MSSLRELERDVHQFLSNLAHVSMVEVEASTTTRGKKKCDVRTFIDSDTKENRTRVYLTEQHLIDRHRSVLFEFSCQTLKATDEQRPVEQAETA